MLICCKIRVLDPGADPGFLQEGALTPDGVVNSVIYLNLLKKQPFLFANDNVHILGLMTQAADTIAYS